MEAAGHEVVYIYAGKLYEITATSNNAGTDLFISIHCNSAGSTQTVGAETYYCQDSSSGKRLATCVQEDWWGWI